MKHPKLRSYLKYKYHCTHCGCEMWIYHKNDYSDAKSYPIGILWCLDCFNELQRKEEL